MPGLECFLSTEGLPQSKEEIQAVLRSPQISQIKCFALGPCGTNIEQASRKWLKETGIDSKSTVELGETPEQCVEMARLVKDEGEISIFWTCAVYYNLFKLFFENPDTLPFFITFEMLLDEMQLATRKELISQVVDARIPEGWKIASHPSPAPLVRYVNGRSLLQTTSNAQAALLCATGQVEACVTTQKAKEIHGLETIHIFGSPPMVFFGGITNWGAKLIKQVYLRPIKDAEYESSQEAELWQG